MPITKEESGFYFWPDAVETPALGIQSENLQACVDEVLRRGLSGVFGTTPYFQEADLEFLRQLPHLTAVELYDVPIRDVSALYDLQSLRSLRLSGKRPGLDFSRLSFLQKLVWEYNKKDAGADTLCNLRFLHLWRYKSQTGDLSDLRLPSEISELGIFWCNARSLDGMSNLPNLTRLEIARCRNLASLTALAESCPNLEHLVVSASGRVTPAEGERIATRLPKIRHLFAGNQLIRSTAD